MDTLHIYRPFDLFLGLGQLIAGLMLMGTELFRLRKCSLRTWAENGQLSGISVCIMTYGGLSVSYGFDPPHKDSLLTGALRWAAIAGMCAGLAIYPPRPAFSQITAGASDDKNGKVGGIAESTVTFFRTQRPTP